MNPMMMMALQARAQQGAAQLQAQEQSSSDGWTSANTDTAIQEGSALGLGLLELFGGGKPAETPAAPPQAVAASSWSPWPWVAAGGAALFGIGLALKLTK